MKEHGRLSRAEKREIRIKRKALRSDLKRRGITSRAEFEIIAQQMGLVYGGKTAVIAGGFWKAINFVGGYGVASALAATGLTLALVYSYSSLTANKQDFTISVSGSLQKVGFDLSETEDFKEPTVRLECDMLENANCISLRNLPDSDILDVNASGNHSEDKRYFAYTFWVRNAGEEDVGYDWELKLKQVSNDADKGIWIMLYDEGKQTIYSRQIGDNEPEHLSGYDKAYFIDEAADKDYQYYNVDNKFGIKTTPYADDKNNIVANGTVDTISPGGKHKYSIVIWIEGDDPDSTNDILGGNAVYDFNITIIDEDKAFDDLMYDKDEYINESINIDDNEQEAE